MMRSRLPRGGFASITFLRRSCIANADSCRMPTWPIHSSSVRREQKSCAAVHRRIAMRLSRILRFLKTIALTKIRRVVYVGIWGQIAGKGTELPGCWTSKGFSCPHFLGVLRHVRCLTPITRCVGKFVAWALLSHLPGPPERSVTAFMAVAIRTHCRLPFDPPAPSTPTQRIAL